MSVRIPTKVLADTLELRWSRQDGFFNDSADELAVYDPTAASEGPSALLVRKDLLERTLADKGLALVWMIFGGKQYMQRDRAEWRGELQMNGAYWLTPSGVMGELTGTYNGPSETAAEGIKKYSAPAVPDFLDAKGVRDRQSDEEDLV